MHDFDDVVGLEQNAVVRGTHHDFSISFHGHGAIGQTEMLDEPGDGQARWHLANFAIDRQAHDSHVRATRVPCQ